MGYNAIEIDGEVKLDLSEDTVTEETLPEGVTAHDANGEPIQGKMKFVKSINGKTGDVTLNASDVDAENAGTVSTHNTNTEAHNDIRLELTRLSGIINDVLDSDDINLNELHEIVAYIKSNSALIAAITVSKVNVADIINNLTTNITDKPLSAAQGVVLKGLIDGLTNSKLDASKLTEAINTALAQAKASGEFDGEDGDPGVGITKAEVVNGNLVITYSTGNKETAGKVKGEDGKDGVLTSAQEELLGKLEDWYDESHYQNMTCDFTSSKASITVDIGSSFDVTFGWDFDKELNYLELTVRDAYKNIVSQTIYSKKNEDDPPEESSVEKTFALSQEGTLSFEIIGKHAGTYGEEVCKNTWTYNFRNKVYYGVRAGETIDEAGIKSLSKFGYATTYNNSFNLGDGSSNKFVWYCFPERFETGTNKRAPKFTAGGFEGSFKKVATIIDFTNGEDWDEPYSVYRSINPGIGDMTITVS